MPGLRACGRRWDIGSDDLVFPALGELLTRTAWLIALAVVLALHKDNFECNLGYLLQMYYIAMLVILSLHMLLDVIIIAISTRGSITNATPRKRLPIFLYLKIVIFVPEIVFTILGTIWAFDRNSECDGWVVMTVKGVTVLGWIILFGLFIGVIIIFDSSGGRTSNDPEDMEASSHSKRLWEMRCKVLCCCVGSDDNSRDAFNDIANLITQFFRGLDVVATDIAAGLMLIQMEQKRTPRHVAVEPPEASLPPIPGPGGDAALNDPPYPSPMDWMNVPLATHYMKFAMASYGWPLFMYGNLLCGACKLSNTCRCCSCIKQSEHVVEDNCCHCNTAAILKTTGIRQEDIIYASFFNRVFEIPFYVALDHEHQAVVIAIRGTLSLRDTLTDMTADSDHMDVEGVDDAQAHKGILQAARFILNTLNNLQLLHTAFRNHTGYRLVVTGHSLGAGAAAILSILLRPSYPNLACFSFAPPGWLLSLPLARYSEDFVCSVVLGDDIIPRLGMITMEKLKVQILKCVRDSQVPKYRILAGGVWYTFCGFPEVDDDPRPPATATDDSNLVSDFRRSYTEESNGMEQALEDAICTSARNQMTLTQLFMPGHVLYIDECIPAGSCWDTPLYQVAWARTEQLDNIIVSPKMLTDHMPDVIHKALVQLEEKGQGPRHRVVKVD
ncbi:hypothetical protein CAPTEDRAFT_162985 [Capitella teleta]|uniref:sn-1-specific diacylglycerol lipase n=1 Tax=Capitella teleta TaxID=283909 RepID=R7UIW4_CAPTE|nr:hypothetical protein CAPTEDRAFT_162985 [Capitella teleta]|eukprot:ELU06110.1 hypothetical protein CAPTEDRAFT_162985 [Capitella teleta]